MTNTSIDFGYSYHQNGNNASDFSKVKHKTSEILLNLMNFLRSSFVTFFDGPMFGSLMR